jgi:hypothetical protein
MAGMCRAVVCRQCGLTTWSGCGRHVDQMMAYVDEANRCPGHPSEQRPGGGILRRLFGRG